MSTKVVPLFRNTLSFAALSFAFFLVACTNKTVTELKIEDLKLGNGAKATAGSVVVVHYTGTLLDGKKFDSSYDHGGPFPFLLGGGQVIQGWDQGVAGMKVGGKRKLTIPANLAYGERSVGQIPPHSPLVFEVELLEVKGQ